MIQFFGRNRGEKIKINYAEIVLRKKSRCQKKEESQMNRICRVQCVMFLYILVCNVRRIEEKIIA